MYRWVDHTAEVELEIEAASEREVFAEALRALAELLGAQAGGGEERREIAATAPDRPALLAAWLEELVLLAESEGFVATGLEQLDLRPDSLNATVSGQLIDPPPLVKAVTYHRLEFEPLEGAPAAAERSSGRERPPAGRDQHAAAGREQRAAAGRDEPSSDRRYRARVVLDV